MQPEHSAKFRFYGELNDFLPPLLRGLTNLYRFNGRPGIKDPIEVFGVPHPEVAAIIVNGQAVGFNYQLQTNDRVAVYPDFKNLDISSLPRLREKISPNPRFVLDVNLGKLVKFMRLLGFDSLYRNDYQDRDIANIAQVDNRIVLTRDRRLLYLKIIQHGYWVRTVKVEKQIDEVLQRFGLNGSLRPYSRCLVCNGVLEPVAKAEILPHLEAKTRLYYDVFSRCTNCRRIYWKGSHMDNMLQRSPSIAAGLTADVD